MAKLKAGRLKREVADTCLQFWGGMGYMWESACLPRLTAMARLDAHRRRRGRGDAARSSPSTWARCPSASSPQAKAIPTPTPGRPLAARHADRQRSPRSWSPTAARSPCACCATAQALGYRTVAVYSEADAGAPHVALADEAVCIGPPPVARVLPEHRSASSRPRGALARTRCIRATASSPRTRSSRRRARKRGWRSSGRRRRRSARWATSARRKLLMEQARRPMRARLQRRGPVGRGAARARRAAHRLPGDGQGGGGRRRARHAPGARPGRAARGAAPGARRSRRAPSAAAS